MHDALANHASRRDFMRRILAAGLCVPASGMMAALAQSQPPQLSPPPELPAFSLSPEDDQFLNDLESANFLFFWEQASPKTGMVKDRCNVHTNDQETVGSEHRCYRFWLDGPLHRRAARLHFQGSSA